MKVSEIVKLLEEWSPLAYQEDYDNAGLITGNNEQEITGILISLDTTEAVIEEAITLGCQMIVAHHPIIFKGLKKLNGKNYVERTIIKAIKNDIAIYASHTNLDNIYDGVNAKISQLIGLENTHILSPKVETLKKLTVFVPQEHTGRLLDTLYVAGAGEIGNYDQCSFQSQGEGSFRPLEKANPFLGSTGMREVVNENRLELIFEAHKEKKILDAMRKGHVYEEVSYFVEKLQNEHQNVGSGMIGTLKTPHSTQEFLKLIKEKMKCGVIKYTSIGEKPIRKVAVCGGAGSFLLAKARGQGADAYVSSDFKYHEYFDSEGDIMITDIGHFESEQFTKDLIKEFFSKKMPNFATYLSKVNTNPVHYYH